jgi:hypothetical protein
MSVLRADQEHILAVHGTIDVCTLLPSFSLNTLTLYCAVATWLPKTHFRDAAFMHWGSFFLFFSVVARFYSYPIFWNYGIPPITFLGLKCCFATDDDCY